MKGTTKKWLAAGLLALALAGQAGAGEMQYALKVGGAMLKVDPDRMVDGDGSSSNGLAVGFSLGYRTEAGLLVELGLMGSGNVDSEHLSGIVHKSLGVGWQFERADWLLTPKVGLVHSYLDSAIGDELLEDGEPSDSFTDTVPYIEAAAEKRFGEHFGVGLYLRHVFEDFGNSQAWGVSLSWNH